MKPNWLFPFTLYRETGEPLTAFSIFGQPASIVAKRKLSDDEINVLRFLVERDYMYWGKSEAVTRAIAEVIDRSEAGRRADARKDEGHA